MRVDFVVPDLHPRSGGPARNVPALAEALVAHGIDVSVHAIGETAVPPSTHVVYRLTRGRLPRRLGRSPELLANLLASTSDIVHAHCLWMRPLAYAARAARAHRAPLIISPRGMLAPWAIRRSRVKKALARLFIHPGALQEAAAWHATSVQEADDIRRLGFPQPVFVVPNGVTPDPDPAASAAYYRRLAPELARRRVLLFYSRFHSKKRVMELLGEFQSAVARHPEWHLLLVGIEEEYSVAELRREAARLGVEGLVTVLDGLHAPKPYAVAELLALPTHDENFGQVVAESLVAGVPVITTTGTPWQSLNEHSAGRWVELTSFGRELDALMAKSMTDLRSAGRRGQEWARTAFAWPSVGGAMKEAYRSVLERWSKNPH